MIEKMKMVHIVTTFSKKQEMLDGLRNLGIVHLAEKKSADRITTERFADLSKTASALKEYEADKQVKEPVLSDEEFEAMYANVNETLAKKAELLANVSATNAEIERIAAWGDFSPSDLKELTNAGYDFHFYRLGSKECEAVAGDESIKMIRLASVDKMDTIAVIGKLPMTIPATEFPLPEKSMTELRGDLDTYANEIAACDEALKKASTYADSFSDQMLKAQNDEIFSSASATAENDDDFVWISGYIPEAELQAFEQKAAEEKWAWAIEEVSEDDEMIPTKVKYNKVSGLIKPVFDILGVLPGYFEQDISIWFLLFFTLFFAMILGDAGYGCIILAGTIAFTVKSKKVNNTLFLLYVLSIATIVWGAITGTWFGSESAMNVPFLRKLVIPTFANYPELFGVETSVAQNTIMKFSFSIGAIQMALGSLLAIKKKIPEKNLSWIADLGWMVAVIAMYMLTLNLVIGEDINLAPVGVCVGVAFLTVVLFGGMSPDKTFGQGLKAGLADAFTVFLNTISCFGNVMSYIRLFAVGMAGFAISQSFNNMAAGFKGPLIIAGVVIVFIGHALNLVMAFLSVVVHGVRLNVLEFSGQVGLEWKGIAYEPFKKNDKITS